MPNSLCFCIAAMCGRASHVRARCKQVTDGEQQDDSRAGDSPPSRHVRLSNSKSSKEIKNGVDIGRAHSC